MDNNKPSTLNFQSKLKDPKSLSIQNDIKKFILTDFPKLASEKSKEDLSKEYQNFITQLISSFCKAWSIKLTYQSEPLYHEISDQFETLLTKQLYSNSTRKEKESDYLFDRLIGKYQFITPSMLEINPKVINEVYLSTAINKLAMINQFKSPKDKMLTFINVVGILSFMYSQFSNKETSPGAEEILPIVIYTVIKSKISKLKSNLNYYLLFRYNPRIVYVEDYYLNTFNAVIDFIDKMTMSDLVITEEEYNKEMGLFEEREKEKLITNVNIISSKNCIDVIDTVNQDEVMLLKYFNNNNDKKSEVDNNKKNSNSLMNEKDKSNIDKVHLFNIDIKKLYAKYYSNKEFDDYTPSQYLQLADDFKIILKLIDSFIQKSNT